MGILLTAFFKRFIDICNQLKLDNEAKSFAFILYNFRDESVRFVLQKQGGFAKLDRMSGKDLAVFYINSEDKTIIKYFNNLFIKAFKIKRQTQLPFVLFFNLDDDDDDVKDVEVIGLQQANIMFSFHELYEILESHVEKLKISSVNKKSSKDNLLYYLLEPAPKIIFEKFVEYLIQKSTNYL